MHLGVRIAAHGSMRVLQVDFLLQACGEIGYCGRFAGRRVLLRQSLLRHGVSVRGIDGQNPEYARG